MSEWKVLESVTSPICPIISAHTVKWANKFVECVKEKCMWWDKCKDLEETRPHGEWIPCSVKMPDKEGNYLVSGKWASGKLAVDSCEYKIDYDGGYFRASHSFDVLAWMPLPNPYKRGEEK